MLVYLNSFSLAMIFLCFKSYGVLISGFVASTKGDFLKKFASKTTGLLNIMAVNISLSVIPKSTLCFRTVFITLPPL